MLYFGLGFILGIVAYITYNLIVNKYLHIKREVQLLKHQKEYYAREVGSLKEYIDWKKGNP